QASDNLSGTADAGGAEGDVVEPEGVVPPAVALPAELEIGQVGPPARVGGQPLIVDVRGGHAVLGHPGNAGPVEPRVDLAVRAVDLELDALPGADGQDHARRDPDGALVGQGGVVGLEVPHKRAVLAAQAEVGVAVRGVIHGEEGHVAGRQRGGVHHPETYVPV